MKSEKKYDGLIAGSVAERAVEIVAAAVAIAGPLLAARLGVCPGDMSSPLNRAIKLGYLTKQRTDGDHKTVTYRLGESALGLTHALPDQLPAAPVLPPAKSRGGRVLTALFARGQGMKEKDLLDAHGRDGMEALSWRNTTYAVLTAAGLIYRATGFNSEVRWMLTDAATALLTDAGTGPVEDPAVQPKRVLPREPAPWKALDVSSLGRGPYRPGAWDFKSIPSHFAALSEGAPK